MSKKKFMLNNREIRIEPTNMCNANCIMCPREKMKRPQGVLDMVLYKRIVDQATEAGAKQISLENFGETFLDPYIFDRAEYAKLKDFEILTITNASLLNEEKARRALELFDVVRVSMYGMTKETFEKIHKGLCFEETMENVERLFAMWASSKTNKTKLQAYFLLMPENQSELRSFLDKYESIASGVSVWKPHNWGDGRIYRERKDKKVSCGRPLTGPLQVQWDGLVVPCCFDYDSRIILGDLNKQSLSEVFRGQRYVDIRRAHSEGNFSQFPFCDICDQLNKRDDVLVYTNIGGAKVGATNTTYFDLEGQTPVL